MRVFIFLSCFINIQADIIQSVTINGVNYDKEIIRSDLVVAQQLAVDYSTNTLYLRYELENESGVTRSGKLNLDTNELVAIVGIEPGTDFGRAVDQETHNVYIIGGLYHLGIFKYDPWRNNVTLFCPVHLKIWNLYYKHNTLYFSTYIYDYKMTHSTFDAQHLYTLKDGNIAKFPDLEDTTVYNFIIDEDYMFFSNNTGLYGQKKGTKERIKYKDIRSIFGALQLTTDIYGKVYALLTDGIYVYTKESNTFDKIVTVYGYGLAFDKDNNFIYSEFKTLYRLKPRKDTTNDKYKYTTCKQCFV